MRIVILGLIFIAGCVCSKPQPEPFDAYKEAQYEFRLALQKAMNRPCIPDYLNAAYNNLLNVVSEDSVKMAEFMETTEQDFFALEQSCGYLGSQ